MWGTYIGKEPGVAIQTTVRQLQKNLKHEEDIYHGKVAYKYIFPIIGMVFSNCKRIVKKV
jgi:hypothetical protein